MSPMRIICLPLIAASLLVGLSACDHYSPPPPAPAPVASNPPPVPPGANARWYIVGFESSSHAIDPIGQDVVNRVVDAMRRDPSVLATIIGKTDTVGSADYNMHLSHQRADAVRDALVYGGQISADRVETRWTGERRPPVNTGADVPAAANRVVDIALH